MKDKTKLDKNNFEFLSLPLGSEIGFEFIDGHVQIFNPDGKTFRIMKIRTKHKNEKKVLLREIDRLRKKIQNLSDRIKSIVSIASGNNDA